VTNQWLFGSSRKAARISLRASRQFSDSMYFSISFDTLYYHFEFKWPITTSLSPRHNPHSNLRRWSPQ
jgi:hypothetical protein